VSKLNKKQQVITKDQFEFMKAQADFQDLYSKETVVVKIGGNAIVDPEKRAVLFDELATIKRSMNTRLVIVNGGGPEINAVLSEMGIEKQFDKESGQRVTDDETLRGVKYALNTLSHDIAGALTNLGCHAMGMSAADDNMVTANVKDGGRIGLVGEVQSVDTKNIEMLLKERRVPVINSVCSDGKGGQLNVNADMVAAHLAGAFKGRLILMTDIDGVRQDINDPDSVIPSIDIASGQIERLKKAGVVSKGMIPKVEACETALRLGARKATIIEGEPLATSTELYTPDGTGTEFYNSKAGKQQIPLIKHLKQKRQNKFKLSSSLDNSRRP